MLEDYIQIQTINDEHKVYLVKNILDDIIYVKKHLSYFERDIYEYLYTHHVSGVPFIKEIIDKNKELIIIEEYVDGETLESVLEKEGIISENQAIDILSKLCKILAQLSKERPFVHRDIKPSNIILKNNNEVYLIDFNASKFSSNKNRDTILLGTTGYAAPEQYGFGSSSIQSDIYAIGVLLKEMITGSSVLNETYKSRLHNIITKCTKMDPDDRYRTYDELLNDLYNKRQLTLKDLIPVGFRSSNYFSKFLGALWYLLIFAITACIDIEDPVKPVTAYRLFVNRACFFLSFVSITLFSGNYLGVQQFFHIRKEWNILLKIILVIIADVVIFFLFLILVINIENLF